MQFHLADRLTENRTLALLAVLALAAVVALGLAALLAYTTPIIALAVTGACIAGAVLVMSLDLAFYAVIATAVLLPFAAVPVNVGFTPTLLDLAVVLVLVLWTLRVLMREQ